MEIDSLGIFLTRKCNFRCTYCCLKTGTDPPDKMTLDELKDAVLQAKALGAKTIVIPGEGEPFLDNNLFPLIEFASENGLRTTIFTNGSLIDQNTASDLFRRKVAIVFKLHSLDRSVYELLAGKDNVVTWEDYYFNKAKNNSISIPIGLKHLLQSGYDKKPFSQTSKPLMLIETVVVQQNIDIIPAIAHFCKSLGIGCVVETLIQSNKALSNYPTLSVTEKEEQKLYYKLWRILGWRFALRQKSRCGFETNPFLDISGNIRHCFSLASTIGNIKKITLAELHKRELNVRINSGMMSKKYSLNNRGFQQCSSKKIINNAT